eukprot:scpid40585/ scgid11569/ Jerky protein homolog-like
MATPKPTKRKRVVLDINQKLEICRLVREKGTSHQRIAEEFGIGRATVHDIVKSEENLKSFLREQESGDCNKKRKAMHDSDYPDLDKAVFTWFVQERCKGELSTPVIYGKK